ncbi:sodium-dependent multivitamin transporter-like [Haliotis cracherodii]|uniref:sodium-dependent multivitamin transporter-like n=1 Tax=Haliotis cracherodii TaxID=6455 RepID=UPI0039EBFF26
METSYSIQTGETKTLGVVDFAVFGCTLSVMLFIGLYFAMKNKKDQDPAEYLVAGRSMGVLPVSLSLALTFLSALTLLGLPAEIYNYTTMFWWLALGMVLAVAGAAHVFNPVLYNIGITSVYEYIDRRYGSTVRVLISFSWVLQTMSYMGTVLYAPSLALKTVTGMELWVSILTVGCLVTLYTSLGGMRAVLWTDSFQAVLILVGLLSVLIQGCITIGGFGRAWEIASENSRIYFHDFSVDPGTRASFWAVVVGGGVMWMSYYSISQSQVQRILACPTLKKAQIAMWCSGAQLVLIVSLCCMVGVVLFAFYKDCDPLQYNLVSTTDELLPLFVMDILGHLPGLPGIFLSCIFSGSLSSLSSGMNAVSAVVLQDYIRPFCSCNINNFTATVITKVTTVACGGISIGIAFVASRLGNLLELPYIAMSIIDGPVFGVFILGMFFPRGNKWGALCGYISGITVMLWIAVGAFIHDIASPMSQFSVKGCNWNATNSTMPTTPTPLANNTMSAEQYDDLSIYRLSFLYYTATGAFINVIVGMIVSFITGYGKLVTTDPKLVFPLIRSFCPCLPKKVMDTCDCTPVVERPPQEDETEMSHDVCIF